MNAVSTAQTYTATIRMGHTTLAALGTTYADNYDAGAPVTVANAVTFSIPAGIPAGEWFWVPLPTSTFTYNGTDNLIVDVVTTAGSGDTDLRITNIANRRAVGGDNTDPVAITVDDNAYHIKLRFNGGTMDVITDGVGSWVIPVGYGSEAIYQMLYDTADLGTGGRITSLSFRLGSPVNTFDHTDVNLVLGHTTLSSLGAASLAANIESDRTAVFSGTISVTAAHQQGDWVKIPLTTPFTYDTTKNLVVQWDAPGYATINGAMGDGGSTRYTDHVQANLGDRTSDVSNATGNFVNDMSLTLIK